MDWLSLLFGFLDSRNQRKDAKAAQQYAEDFAKSVEFKPWDVSGPLGSATFEDGSATTALSPEMQNQLTGLFSQASGYGDALAAYDPAAAQQQMYQQQRSMFAPQQAQDRLAMENRLLAQGMLGSTGGAGRTQSLLEAQGQQDQAAQLAAWQQAQQQQQNLQQGYNSSMNNILNMGNSVSGLFGTGSGLGAEASLAAYRGGDAVLTANTAANEGRFQWGDLGGSNKDGKELWDTLKNYLNPPKPTLTGLSSRLDNPYI